MPVPLTSSQCEITDLHEARRTAPRYSAAMGCLAFALMSLRLASFALPQLWLATVALLLGGPVAVSLRRRVAAPRRLRDVRVSVTEGALVIEDPSGRTEPLALAPDGAVWVEAREEGHDLVVTLKHERTARIRVADARTAAQFAKMIRSARDPRAASDAKKRPFGAVPLDALEDHTKPGAMFAMSFAAVLVALFLPTLTTVVTLAGAASFVVLAAVFARKARGERLFVGTDGLAIGGSEDAPPAFLPFARIERARADGGELVIEHVGGGETRIGAGRPGSAQALAREIGKRARAAEKKQPLEISRLFARVERDPAAWIARIANTVFEGAYRTKGVPVSDAVEVAASTSAPVDERVGAALAVARTRDRDAADRVRIAARASADPALTRALLAAAEGELDEAAVEQAKRARA